jgi:hypothetical protein
MKLLSLLDTIGGASTASTAAEAAATTPTGRRALLRSAGQAGVRALATALPLMAVLPAVAGPAAETVFDSLRLVLTFADLEEALYSRALNTAGLVPAEAKADIQIMQQQQKQHASFLRSLFTNAGAVVPAVPNFDFSGSHNGSGPAQFNAFSSFDKFLELAQPLADAAARCYLGQLNTIHADNQLLDVMLRRQAVEARHASHLRTLRRNLSNTGLPKSWPSTTDPTLPPALALTQTGENNTDQLVPGLTAAGVFSGSRYINFNLLFPDTPVQTTSLSEAFDEPLTTAQATQLLALFQ